MDNPAEHNIDITIPDNEWKQLIKAFGPCTGTEEEDNVISRFSEIAYKEFYYWVTGQKRYRSLTEQYIDWVEQIYTLILPREEAPSADRIYNTLNMPHGQATYIARVLAAKTLVYWRNVAVQELNDILKDQEANARKYLDEGDQAQPIQVQLSSIAVQELQRVCSARRRNNRSYVLPQPGNISGDYRFVSIPACTIVDLLDNNNW